MTNSKNTARSTSTEEQIKEAARRVFTAKGYAATRTRDIAEESGFNLALINYYFRSKEKLFDIIMTEQLQMFIHSISGILNDEQTTLQNKIALIADHYIDMLIANPGLPIFIMNEVNVSPEKLMEKLGFGFNIKEFYIVKQWQQMVVAGKLSPATPIHLIMNMISMIVFPFVASPMMRQQTGKSIAEFNELMLERKKLIPQWIGAMMNNE
jgi:AcrR family transcriptional regulator